MDSLVSKEEVVRSGWNLRDGPPDHADSPLSEYTLAHSPAPKIHLRPTWVEV